MNDYERIKDILVCPACHGYLTFNETDIACKDCGESYPLYKNVPQFAILTDSETERTERVGKSTSRYEQRYDDYEKAQNYNLKYERKFLKRLSTKREYQLLKRLLRRQSRCAMLLEIPCGGGRVSPQLADGTDILIQADVALGQVIYGMEREPLRIPQVWMTASAFQMPFRNASIDGVVCIRLSHHLATLEQREQLLIELLRVTRRFVIMTFFDYHSLKNMLRRIRRKKPKLTMTVDQVAALAKAHGARLISYPQLSIVGSGHRYALMVKES